MRSTRLPVVLASLLLTAWCALGRPVGAAVPGAGQGSWNRHGVELAIRAERRERPLFPHTGDQRATSPLFRATTLEQRLFADAADGRWDQHSLWSAALIASGVNDDQSLQRYLQQAAALVDELRRSGAVNGSAKQKAQAVFEFMHRRILTAGYQFDATDLTSALDKGMFNCVSASVLFNCLAEQFGLTTRGLEIPAHAMSRLVLPEGVLDIETTCPEWFRLLDKPEKQAELVEQTLGFQPNQPATQPREVSGVELVATIYYNRGVDLLAQKQFAEAVAANAKALRLDPSSTTAHGNLLASINNWAIDLGAQGDFAEAADLLERGMTLDPRYDTFQANFTHVYYQWVEVLCREERFRESLDLLAAGMRKVPKETYFSQARLEVYRRWTRAQFQADRAEVAFAVLAEAKRLYGSSREVLDLEVAEVTYRASVLLDEGRFAEAAALFDQGLAHQPDSEVLAQNRQVILARWAGQSGDSANPSRATAGKNRTRSPDRDI
jgi:tetratricopeptide (TPR) repeat protein